jgi:hypothetical protein
MPRSLVVALVWLCPLWAYGASRLFGAAVIEPGMGVMAASSGVDKERGVATLRWDESPGDGGWAAPAVALGLATANGHGAPDQLSIAGYYVFDKRIYPNRKASVDGAGLDPTWSDSVRSRCAVIVDGLEPRPVGVVATRQAFGPLVKYVAATAKGGVYPDVTQTRALFLTKEYLFDLSHLYSPRGRNYLWQVHTLGHLTPDNPQDFAPTRYLLGTLQDLVEERSWVANDRGWSMTAVRTSTGPDAAEQKPGGRRFEGRVGVRVTMLGEPGQLAFTATSPVTPGRRDRLNHGADEEGGATIVAARNAAVATFAVLHEPFMGRAKIHSLRRLQQVEDAIGVAVTGEGVEDRILFRWGSDFDRLVTLGGPGESFTFGDRAYLRISRERIDACGDLRGLTMRAAGSPKLFLNGKEQPVSVAEGVLTYGPPAKGDDTPGQPAAVPLPEGPVAARFARPSLRLPIGGKGVATLHIRNNGFTPLTMKLHVEAAEGVVVRPESITLSALEPGQEQAHPIEVSAPAGMPANQLFDVTLTAGEGATIPVQEARLKVSHGVAKEASQHFPNEPAMTVYSPAYVAKYYVQQSAAAAFLLDPAGRRRFPADGTVFPTIVTKDAAGKSVRTTPGPYGYFSPQLKDGALVEPGQHPRGARSPFEYRFTERWIELRMKDPPADVVSLDLWAEDGFEKALLATPDGKVVALERNVREDRPLLALFRLPANQTYGVASFYPPGATLDSGTPFHAGGEWMAFTFCTEAEFGELVTSWASRGR